MSILHPEDAEESMEQVPLFCCLVPLILTILIGGALLVWLL
jgi:hypothetical protein